jgi:hypothetical protein
MRSDAIPTRTDAIPTKSVLTHYIDNHIIISINYRQ